MILPPSPRVAGLGLLLGAWLIAAACSGSPQRTTTPTAPPARAVAAAPAVDARTVGARTAGWEADVGRLCSNDFVERSRAADRLVEAGERALPALGRAGNGETQVHGSTGVSTTRPVIRSILAELDQRQLYAHLDSSWPVIRREAAEELGRRGHWSAVPQLIDRLEDSDTDVRATAASSLRRLTNRFFGYDARAHDHARAQAADRWQRWWNIEARVASPEGTREREG